jgi:hypothetical protein
LYIYACHGGELAPHLADCEAFGHVGTVPVVLEQGDCVDRFLRCAIELVVQTDFDRSVWQQTLVRYLEREEAAAYESDGEDVEEFYLIAALRRSLNYGRPM